MSEAVQGHNGIAADELKQFVERIERLEEEKAAIAGDIKDVYAEVKSRGFNASILRQIVRMRKEDHAKRMEREAILELYMEALGMLAGTPLGDAAVSRAMGGR